MSFLKKPLVALLLSILIVFASTAISINVKLNNKCDAINDSFYEAKLQQGLIVTSIYSDIVKMYEVADDIVLVAENYGIDTRALVSSIQNMRNELNFKNTDFSDIYSTYSTFCSELRAVEIALSGIGLSQRHIEYMNSASEQIFQLKSSIDASSFNDNVRTFYKKFDRFPVNIFADIFDIDYPEYFA